MEEKVHISNLLKYFLLLTLFPKYIHILPDTAFLPDSVDIPSSSYFHLSENVNFLLIALFFPYKMNIVYACWRRRKKEKKPTDGR